MSVYINVPRMPLWLKKPLPDGDAAKKISDFLKARSIETVCVNSRCPNKDECYSFGNVSFLIMGKICTRGCAFCAIEDGAPDAVNPGEPQAIADAVKKLALNYVVITSVTRDDLSDGGAGHYSEAVKAVKEVSPEAVVETLVPDFKGSQEAIDKVINSGINVFSHNIETVGRLYPEVRGDSNYSRSMDVLRYAAACKQVIVKSGFMAGLGETEEEVDELLRGIKDTGCSLLTIGQYLRPWKSQLTVKEYVRPEQFLKFKEKALKLGFKNVASGPFVRSSYMAEELIM